MEVHAKLGGKSSVLKLDAEGSVGSLHDAIRHEFDLDDCHLLKILVKGKAVTAEQSTPLKDTAGIVGGAKLMVMASRRAEVVKADEAPRERMRGFEEDDERHRTGSTGGKTATTAFRTRTSETHYRFHATAALRNLPPGCKPSVAAAEARLNELANDPSILAIMKRHSWSVGLLSEMPPDGQVGVSACCVMGLNKNKGQEILLRLRTDDGQGLRPYASVIPVLLHELTHNVHSDHDDAFKALCSQLGREYKEHSGAGHTLDGGSRAACRALEPDRELTDRGQVLGGGHAKSIEEARAVAFGYSREPPPAKTQLLTSAGCLCGACEMGGATVCAECEAEPQAQAPADPRADAAA